MHGETSMGSSACGYEISGQNYVSAVTHIAKECVETSTTFKARFQYGLGKQCRLQFLAGTRFSMRAQISSHEVV